MRLPSLALAALAFAGCTTSPPDTIAVPPQSPCDLLQVRSPADGQTAVPLDVHVVLDSAFRPAPDSADGGTIDFASMCPDFRWTRDDGQAVSFSAQQKDGATELVPDAPLAADHTYEVGVGTGEQSCFLAAPPFARFRTAPAPALAAIDIVRESEDHWHGLYEVVGQVTVRLSEPVRNPDDLLPSKGFVEIVPQYALGSAVTAQDTQHGGTTLVRRYDPADGATGRPRVTETLHVRVKKGLAFASGAALAADLDQALVPDQFPLGWKPGAAPVDCASHGCQSAPAGALAFVALALRRATRTRARGAPERPARRGSGD